MNKREDEPNEARLTAVGATGQVFLLLMLPVVSACGAIYGTILGEFAGQYISRPGTLTAWEALRRSVHMPLESWIGTAWLGGIVGLVIRMATWPRSRRRLVIILVIGFLATLLPAGCYSWVFSSLD